MLMKVALNIALEALILKLYQRKLVICIQKLGWKMGGMFTGSEKNLAYLRLSQL